MNKFAIYTACIGGYDNILQPKVVDERFDYFLFTNDVKEERVGVWQVRKVGYTHPDMTRIARYVKTHPEELLPEYEATLWMDSNIQINLQAVYERFTELYNNRVDIASIKHPERDCIYDEAFKIVQLKLEHDTMIFNWCSLLRHEGYPAHNGLYETSILYRLSSSKVRCIDKLWWNCINKYSKRDQLSLNYAIWINQPNTAYFLSVDEDARRTKLFNYKAHSAKRSIIKQSFFEKIRWWNNFRNVQSHAWAKRRYYRLYALPYAPVALYLSTVYDLLCKTANYILRIPRKIKKKLPI